MISEGNWEIRQSLPRTQSPIAIDLGGVDFRNGRACRIIATRCINAPVEDRRALGERGLGKRGGGGPGACEGGGGNGSVRIERCIVDGAGRISRSVEAAEDVEVAVATHQRVEATGADGRCKTSVVGKWRRGAPRGIGERSIRAIHLVVPNGGYVRGLAVDRRA